VRVLGGDQEVGGVGVGLQRVGGDHHAGQVQGSQQRLERGHLLGRAAELALGQHRAAGVVHRRQQVHRATVAACRMAPRRVLPSTAMARRRLTAGPRRSRSASQVPMAPGQRVWVQAGQVRRMVASAGTAKQPGAWWRAPSPARTGWGASAAHSAIAAIDRAPASTAAAAVARMATSGWRRPRVARGSGTAAR
jgi:hypothetical protein